MTHSMTELAARMNAEVLVPLKRAFVGKDEIIDLLGVCLVGGENLFLLGPPGTAKSALIHALGRRIHGRVFDYLFTRFTEPNELFGPFDIRRLREGELVTNTDGMLPEASLVFLDELLNANSAILNSLLTVLNERVFRRGRETRPLPTLMVVGASNTLPEDESLRALFDRFLLRVECENVLADRLADVLHAGWNLEWRQTEADPTFTADDIRLLQRGVAEVDLSNVRTPYIETIDRLRKAGIAVSDRRAVKLQRLMAASALLAGRTAADPTDQWVLRHIWDTEEQIELLASIVSESLARVDDSLRATSHPRATGNGAPDAESLARDLEQIGERLGKNGLPPAERSTLADRLGLLAGRCQWVEAPEKRTFLEKQIDTLWKRLGTEANP